MENLKEEANKLKDMHKNLVQHTQPWTAKDMKLDNEIRIEEMKCYRRGDQPCLIHYENYFFGSFESRRKMDTVLRMKEEKCWNAVPFSFRPKNEYSWEARSIESLREYQKFYKCAKPYEENITQLFKESVEMKERILRNLVEFNKNDS